MCLIICAFQYQKNYPLVITANRDEYFSRPTDEADFWLDSDPPLAILAGKDLTQGGTWLGVNPYGRFAAVTNIRSHNTNGSGEKSRGFLVRDFLSTAVSAEEFALSLISDLDRYAGFNLLIGDTQSLYYLNNKDGMVEKLPAGVYGLSNGTLDSPWPKVDRGKSEVRNMLEQNNELSTDALISLMTDRQIAEDDGLPETGVSLELERLLSPSFISNPERDYGTRCSTALIVDSSSGIRFSEQSYSRDSSVISRSYFSFSQQQLQPAAASVSGT